MAIESSEHKIDPAKRLRIAYYGGSFDPVHRGHLAIGVALRDQFRLDQFVFVPAFHAPHKKRTRPTSAFDRYAMLCLSTASTTGISVSKIEIQAPERPYTVETLGQLKSEGPDDEIFFVMGADSWADITTWKEWETVLSLTNHIVVTRPGFELRSPHVTDDVRARVVDLRGEDPASLATAGHAAADSRIFLTDVANLDISATAIRQKIREHDISWHKDVPKAVANYIEKYQIYT
ncbi:MAG: nicotinate-nucleotide adenylyltransferase [Acidobacteriota bacterium]